MICNVLQDENETNELSIIFKYEDRLFTFKRKINESLENCSKRMKINLEKSIKNKVISDIKFFVNDIEIINLENVNNKDFWKNGSMIKINGIGYEIKYNYPHVLNIRLSNIILSGYYIYPYLDLKNGNIDQCQFMWYRSNNEDCTDWSLAGEGFLYKVRSADLHNRLKIVCISIRDREKGISAEAISPKNVMKGPDNCPFKKVISYLQTKKIDTNAFRVLSYNLLADLYANSEYSKDILYSYCNNSYLNFSYRKILLIEEILGYDCDIGFLQELDSIFYQKGFKHILSLKSYDSYFIAKDTNSEGLCIFVRQNKFETLTKESFTFSDLIQNSDYEHFKLLKIKLLENEQLFNRIIKLKNTFQILIVKSLLQTNSICILCNLHLYSKDDADHIRLVQTYITLKYLEKCYDELNAKYDGKYKISIILSGDFNSTPEWGVVEFIKSKIIDSTWRDFQSNKSEIIDDFVWHHKFDLDSGCGFPLYTHYAQHFNGCLDYIFYDKINLDVIDIAPMANHEDVTKEIALPNEKIPSDHLPLICTLSWK